MYDPLPVNFPSTKEQYLSHSKQIQQMLKSSRKALSLELLTKHQQRIKTMVSKIQTYRPQFHVNKGYGGYKRAQVEKRMQEREKMSDKLFEENMKLIYRIETTGPKVETKKFPSVSPNPKRIKSLSQRSHNTTRSNPKFKIMDVFRNQEELFQENVKLITNIECTGPKIQCWVSKKTRKLSELIIQKKRDEQKKIIDKYKQISKEFNKLAKMSSYKRSSSIGSIKSRSEVV